MLYNPFRGGAFIRTSRCTAKNRLTVALPLNGAGAKAKYLIPHRSDDN